jgi:predicted nuclease of restriction endonuclease-like RecB superfamily
MTFRSGLEEKVADLLVSLGVDYEYEETSYPYTIQHQYTPDFVLPDNGVILEVKGYWDPPSRRKTFAWSSKIHTKGLVRSPRQHMRSGVSVTQLNGALHIVFQLIG